MDKFAIIATLDKQRRRIRKLLRNVNRELNTFKYETEKYRVLVKKRGVLWHEELDLCVAISQLEQFIENRDEVGKLVKVLARYTEQQEKGELNEQV